MKKSPVKRSIGFHLSITGGIANAVKKALELDVNALQVFLKNNNQWKGKELNYQDADMTREMVQSHALYLVAHTGYLINCAGEGEVYEKSVIALEDELKRADAYGVEGLVLHPGSHKEKGVGPGIRQVAETLDKVYDNNNFSTPVYLETMAGQGTSLGRSFEELAEIIHLSNVEEKLAVCLDTAHIFAAGYDISSFDGTRKVVSDFDNTLGLHRLKLIHLNDSKKECNSNRDRHEHIGEGFIGEEGMKSLLNYTLLQNVPVIMETPKNSDDSWDRKNLNTVRKLLKS